VALECRLMQELRFGGDGARSLVIGEVQAMQIRDGLVDAAGRVDTRALTSLAASAAAAPMSGSPTRSRSAAHAGGVVRAQALMSPLRQGGAGRPQRGREGRRRAAYSLSLAAG
jgi:hypothetical protein